MIELRRLGLVPYESTWQAMLDFTDHRTATTPDQIWLLQHPPTFTLGRAGRLEHVLDAGEIPLVQIDRGGQVTYHGPGQWVIYPLLDLQRLGLGVRQLVTALERSVIELLQKFGITAEARAEAPGVYVDGAKIAAVGLRIRKGCSLHGLSFNVAMDLEPFHRINPCGYPGLAVTELAQWIDPPELDTVGEMLLESLLQQLDALSSSGGC